MFPQLAFSPAATTKKPSQATRSKEQKRTDQLEKELAAAKSKILHLEDGTKNHKAKLLIRLILLSRNPSSPKGERRAAALSSIREGSCRRRSFPPQIRNRDPKEGSTRYKRSHSSSSVGTRASVQLQRSCGWIFCVSSFG